MPRTTGRTLRLLDLLQAGRTWTGPNLCDRLEVSPRTLRRDIEDLRGLGSGVEAAPGPGGGYRLGPGASLPPLTLTQEEAVAIAVGLRVSAFSVVTGIEDAAMAALAKLEQSLSSATRERIAAIETSLVPLVPMSADEVPMDVLITVAGSIRGSRELHVDYSRHDGETRQRVIQAHRVVRTADRWYVIARYPDDPNWRTLRLDRLVPRLPLGRSFVPGTLSDAEVRRLTSTRIAVDPYAVQVTVVVAAPAEEVERWFGPTVAEVRALDDRRTELRTGANSVEDLVRYLGAAPFELQVVEGDELREALRPDR